MDRIRQDKRGTSLIEILVVMVVLLVGIMTVIQMFPTGFGVVKAAESRTIATRLGQQELERWKTMSANLPQGFLAVSDVLDPYGLPIPINEQYPGEPFSIFEPSGGSWKRGNVLNIRWVREETVSIPAPSYFQTSNGTAFGSKYTVAFAPIDVYYTGATLNGLKVKSGQLKRITSVSGNLSSLKQGQYLINYDTVMDGSAPSFRVAFPKQPNGTQRTYYISYSYWAWNDGDQPVLYNALDQDIVPDPAYSNSVYWIPVHLPTGYDNVEIEPNTDLCSRGFRPLSVSNPWPEDPYTFKLADSILGVLAFNPNAQNLYEYTALGKRPIEARIDYRIYDLRILREDKVVPVPVPGAAFIPVKLALRFILDAGKPDDINDGDPTDNPDEPTFEGLMRGSGGVPQLGQKVTGTSGLIISYSMLIVDLQTGLRVGVTDPGDPAKGIPVDSIDYKIGVVHLPLQACLIDYNNDIQDSDVDLKGRNLRFLYRADGDWSVQCHKAYANYSRVYETTGVDYCHYCTVPGNGDVCRLLFARCDAGKTVSVDYTYVAADGVEHRVVGKAYQISDYDIGNSSKLHFVDLEVLASQIKRISVMGTSFTARVIWRDGKHWRYVDMDTSLVRGGG